MTTRDPLNPVIPEDHDDALLDAERHNFLALYRPISIGPGTRLSPPPWLLGPPELLDEHGLIRTKTITMVSAEPFTGKTMLLLAMALGLAAERETLGYRSAPGHRVMFIGQDAPTWDYMGQTVKLWQGLGEPSLRDCLLFLNRGWRLTDPRFPSFIAEAVSIFGISVLMLDTLLSFHDADENSNKEMSAVMDLLKSLRDTHGLSIIFSHHTGKAPGISGNYRARGASVIAGSVDFHLSLSSRGSVISLNLPKRRGSQKRGAQGFAILDSPSGGIILEPRASTKSALALLASFLVTPRSQDEILAFLHDCYPGTTPEVIAGRLHGTLGQLKRTRRYLIQTHSDGRISCHPTSSGSRDA